MIERVEAALRIISSLSGLAQENMTQLAGWRFLELGRRIERAILTCRLVRCFAPSRRARRRPRMCCSNWPTARSPIGSATSWSRRARRSSIWSCSIPTIRARSRSSSTASRRILPPCRDAAPPAGCRRCSRSPPRSQRACAPSTRPPIDEALIVDIEQSLMKLSDAITAAYLTTQRALRSGVGGAGVIYDVRQTTTCTYASPVAHARHVLRLMPIRPPRPARACRRACRSCRNRAHRREGQDFFGNRLTWVDIEEPHENAHGQTGGARRRRRGGRA